MSGASYYMHDWITFLRDAGPLTGVPLASWGCPAGYWRLEGLEVCRCFKFRAAGRNRGAGSVANRAVEFYLDSGWRYSGWFNRNCCSKIFQYCVSWYHYRYSGRIIP